MNARASLLLHRAPEMRKKIEAPTKEKPEIQALKYLIQNGIKREVFKLRQAFF